MSRIIVVSGTRRSPPGLRNIVYGVLNDFSEADVYLFHGGQNGVDELADNFAHKCGWQPYPFPYPRFDGKRGGPARNFAFCAAARTLADKLGILVEGHTFPDAQSVGTYRAEKAMGMWRIPFTRHLVP